MSLALSSATLCASSCRRPRRHLRHYRRQDCRCPLVRWSLRIIDIQYWLLQCESPMCSSHHWHDRDDGGVGELAQRCHMNKHRFDNNCQIEGGGTLTTIAKSFLLGTRFGSTWQELPNGPPNGPTMQYWSNRLLALVISLVNVARRVLGIA